MAACCDMMKDQVQRWAKDCSEHPDEPCPDMIIIPLQEEKIGIPIHDGGNSAVVISYCPWCGTEATEEAWYKKGAGEANAGG